MLNQLYRFESLLKELIINWIINLILYIVPFEVKTDTQLDAHHY